MSPSTRLIASIISAVLIITLTDALVVRTGIEIVDNIISSKLIAALLTALCLVSMCHAINIIDGLNGLAGLTAVLCFSATCIIAYEVNDMHIVLCNLVLAATTLGFVIFNFPKARIFLGDGGAYFLGLMIGFLAIILPLRNPVVHPFASMLIVIYPCYELGRSIVRRWRNRTIMTADGAHLHSLTYKLVARNMDHRPRLNQWLGSNAIASLIVLAFPTMNALIAVFFHNNVNALIISLVAFVALYEAVYRSIARRQSWD